MTPSLGQNIPGRDQIRPNGGHPDIAGGSWWSSVGVGVPELGQRAIS
jgi:hypothetical protein